MTIAKARDIINNYLFYPNNEESIIINLTPNGDYYCLEIRYPGKMVALHFKLEASFEVLIKIFGLKIYQLAQRKGIDPTLEEIDLATLTEDTIVPGGHPATNGLAQFGSQNNNFKWGDMYEEDTPVDTDSPTDENIHQFNQGFLGNHDRPRGKFGIDVHTVSRENIGLPKYGNNGHFTFRDTKSNEPVEDNNTFLYNQQIEGMKNLLGWINTITGKQYQLPENSYPVLSAYMANLKVFIMGIYDKVTSTLINDIIKVANSKNIDFTKPDNEFITRAIDDKPNMVRQLLENGATPNHTRYILDLKGILDILSR